MTEPSMLGVDELTAAYAGGELSPVEVVSAVFEHIDRWEPSINAMYLVHRDSALKAAKDSEKRWQQKASRSPLDGVPITLKENLYTVGDPAPIGTAAGFVEPKTVDAPPCARVREAGCVILGKTTMPDYGMLSSGQSSLHGTTRNPWNTEMNPAGSSSGAGAACAAGYGPLHVGTDIGGSIRLPATHCGVFGLKPSFGRVPIDPPYLGRVAGPITRTVADAASLLGVLSQPDARDYMSMPSIREDYRMALEGRGPKGLRIALVLDLRAGLKVDAVVTEAVREAARALQTAGAHIDTIETFLSPEMLDGICLFFETRSCNDVLALDPAARARVLPFITEWATWRAERASARELMAAYTQVVAMREAASRTIAQYDFMLTPVSPIPPYSADLAAPTNDPHNALAHIAFTVPWNLSEHPAASVPWKHTPEGLPIGVQIIGQRFDDLGVLQLSRVLEHLRPEQMPWPEPGAAMSPVPVA